MIRFALKSAFCLGVLAFALPMIQGAPEGGTARVDVFGAMVGAQQALSDLGGFCDRAPQACATGREMAAFAGERIEEGARIAYSLVNERIAGSETSGAAEADPVMTGAVEAPPSGPQPYRAPRRDPALLPDPAETASVPVVPTPTPRP